MKYSKLDIDLIAECAAKNLAVEWLHQISLWEKESKVNKIQWGKLGFRRDSICKIKKGTREPTASQMVILQLLITRIKRMNPLSCRIEGIGDPENRQTSAILNLVAESISGDMEKIPKTKEFYNTGCAFKMEDEAKKIQVVNKTLRR